MSRARAEERDRDAGSEDGEGRERSRSPKPDRDNYDVSGPMGGGNGGDVRPGDWTCPSCGANVFASKLACFRCSTPKPGIDPADLKNSSPMGGGH